MNTATVAQETSTAPRTQPCVRVGDVCIGGTNVVLIAGPCAIESAELIERSAAIAKSAGVSILRGGAFKPRTSPYTFQGHGYDALAWFRAAADKYELPIVTEVMDIEQVDLIEPVSDMLQIGSRNMQNFSLLKRVGRSNRPILLKRGMAATLQELLNAAEYIRNEGNEQIVICERGIRTFTDYSRSTFDVTIIAKLKQLAKYPVIADPSHATGDRSLVIPVAQAAIAAGADGVMIEFHPDPTTALSDGDQSLFPEQLIGFAERLPKYAAVVDRHFGS